MNQITVRLSPQLNRKIDALAKQYHLKRSDIVRLALESYVSWEQGHEGEDKPYHHVSDLIGNYESGVKDLGENHRQHLINKLKKK